MSSPMAIVATKLLQSDLVSSHVEYVLSDYIRPVSDRPDLLNVETSDAMIPLIDLQCLAGANRSQVVEEIGLACQDDGFFQVTNHGIPKDVIEGMLRVAKEFFYLSESERLKSYFGDPAKTTRLSTSFNVKTEKARNWRDYFKTPLLSSREFHAWTSGPPILHVLGT